MKVNELAEAVSFIVQYYYGGGNERALIVSCRLLTKRDRTLTYALEPSTAMGSSATKLRK